QEPGEADRFPEGCRLFPVDECGLPQLSKQKVDVLKVPFTNRFLEVVDDCQYVSRIELSGMGGEHNANAEIVELFFELFDHTVGVVAYQQFCQRSFSVDVVDLRESGIFNGIEEHDLAFGVLNKIKQQIEEFF